MASVFYHLHILVQSSLLHFEWRRPPLAASTSEFLLRDPYDIDRVSHSIDGNHVPIVYQRDWPADLGFRYDVTNHEPMRPIRAREICRNRNQPQKRVNDMSYPPLKRPSVRQATSCPSPAPMIKLVGFNISGIPMKGRCPLTAPPRWNRDVPGPPFGPRYRSTTTVFSPFFSEPLSTAAVNSSSPSNVRAFPVNCRPSFPVILETDPPGARFPRRILRSQAPPTRNQKIKIRGWINKTTPNMASGFNWVGQWSDNILVGRQLPILCSPPFQVFTEGKTGHRHIVSVY